jgi:AbrB family looped-hinge helix DNA binding protein
MPTVRIRERGQVTIPSSFRKDLGLDENDTLNMVKIDEMLILTQRKPFGDTVARKVESAMKRKGLTLDDLLVNLKDQRKKYNRETHAKTKT